MSRKFNHFLALRSQFRPASQSSFLASFSPSFLSLLFFFCCFSFSWAFASFGSSGSCGEGLPDFFLEGRSGELSKLDSLSSEYSLIFSFSFYPTSSSYSTSLFSESMSGDRNSSSSPSFDISPLSPEPFEPPRSYFSSLPLLSSSDLDPRSYSTEPREPREPPPFSSDSESSLICGISGPCDSA